MEDSFRGILTKTIPNRCALAKDYLDSAGNRLLQNYQRPVAAEERAWPIRGTEIECGN